MVCVCLRGKVFREINLNFVEPVLRILRQTISSAGINEKKDKEEKTQ